jgi:sigma-B regulation protein RsbU (phosphoserine phosphatase)
MNATFFTHIRSSLLEQRQNLSDWLTRAPARQRQIRLGPVDEQAAQAHLQVLDTAIAKTEDQTLGLCEVCHDYIEPSRLEMDYTCCVCLDHLSPEEQERLEFELELSGKVQQALLPQQLPDIPGLQLAAFSRPAHYVTGDYFDFFHFHDNAPGLVIGDVAGKGMSASLLMASLQASLRTLAPDYASPAEVARRLNTLFYHNIRLTRFVTLFLARFDSATRTLTYCNAGHNPPLLYRAHKDLAVLRNLPGLDSEIAWLGPTGAAIGLVEAFQFGEENVTLEPGDVLLFYTDGVTEAINAQEEEFGPERLVELVRQGAGLSPQELVRAVRLGLQEFINGQPLADDTTIIAGQIET